MLTDLLERESVKTGLLLFVTILLAVGCCLTAIADEKASLGNEVVILDVDNMT